MPIDLPFHYPTYSFWFFHSNKPLVLTCLFYIFANLPFHQPTGSIYFFHLALRAHLSVNSPADLHTDRPTRKLMYLLISMLLANHEDLSADSTVYMSIDAPVQRLSPFIFMHPFRFTSTIYPSTQLLLYMYTDLPGNKSTCLSWCLPSG